MFFSIETELPSGTRLRLQRDRTLWVATFASSQFVVKRGNEREFIERARTWCEGNVGGASLQMAYNIINHYAAVVREVEAALLGELQPDYLREGGAE